MRELCIVVAALLAGVAGVAPCAAQERVGDSLTVARELYGAAEYESALGVLERLKPTVAGADAASVEQYRAFCLLALGRTGDAEQAIEALVRADPSSAPADSSISPRVRTLFRDVRVRTLPVVILERYDAAKGAFDRREFERAAAAFADVARLLSDPDVALLAERPPLSDVKKLAGSFQDLSVIAATPAPAPPAAPAPVTPVVFSASDRDVTPPVALKQVLPPHPGPLQGNRVGVLEVQIDERGVVEQVAIRATIDPRYDKMVLAAARNWRYQPAQRQGAAVKFRKMVQVSVQKTN